MIQQKVTYKFINVCQFSIKIFGYLNLILAYGFPSETLEKGSLKKKLLVADMSASSDPPLSRQFYKK